MLRDSRLRWRNEKDETGLFKTFRDRKRQKKTKRDRKRHFETLEKQESSTEHKKEKEKQKSKNKNFHGAKEESIRRIFKNILASDPQGLWFLFLVRRWDFSKNLPVNIKPIT